MVDGARDFRLFTRQMLDAILEMEEYNRYSKGIFSFVGFKTKWLEYENPERVAGTTKWNFVGILFCLIAFIMVVVIVIKTLCFGDPVSGWPSLACIILFVSGVQLFCIGIMGLYLSKTYLETKKRPIYIIKETENDLKKKEKNK